MSDSFFKLGLFNIMKKIIYLFTYLFLFCYQAFAMDSTQMAISYTDIGSGTPLILIHAFPADQTLWTPQLDLKQNFRVITIDLAGFGQAKQTNGDAVTMQTYAEQVKNLMDKLHIEKAIIGGESMGGYVSLAFLQQYSDRVLGLILSDTQSIADSNEAKAKREAAAQNVLANGPTQLVNDFLPKALSANASEETRNYLHSLFEKQSSTAIASALRGMALRSDTSTILSNTTLPVLIITGDQDVVISSQQSKNMQAITKNSKLVIIANAGHLSSLEQPQAWNKAVVEMFAESKYKA